MLYLKHLSLSETHKQYKHLKSQLTSSLDWPISYPKFTNKSLFWDSYNMVDGHLMTVCEGKESQLLIYTIWMQKQVNQQINENIWAWWWIEIPILGQPHIKTRKYAANYQQCHIEEQPTTKYRIMQTCSLK